MNLGASSDPSGRDRAPCSTRSLLGVEELSSNPWHHIMLEVGVLCDGAQFWLGSGGETDL